MSTSYKINVVVRNADATAKRSITIGNADSGVTKQKVEDFADQFENIQSDMSVLASATLISTTSTDLLVD